MTLKRNTVNNSLEIKSTLPHKGYVNWQIIIKRCQIVASSAHGFQLLSKCCLSFESSEV